MNNADNYVFASEKVGNLTVEVIQDIDPMNPRDYEYESIMVCFHKRYNLGDKDTGYKEADFDSWDEVYDQLRLDDYQTILALYLYDHSGIGMSTRPFTGRAPHAEWDSGQVGFIATKEAGKEEQLVMEVAEYDAYISGQVYSFRIFDEKEVYEYRGQYFQVEDALRDGKAEAPYYEKVGA